MCARVVRVRILHIMCLLDSGFERHFDPGHIGACGAAGRTDLTVPIVQRRLDAYTASLAQRL